MTQNPAGLVPIGGVLYFIDTYQVVGSTYNFSNTLPDEYIALNGQVITDPQSPLRGAQLPDVNGATGTPQPRFIRGQVFGTPFDSGGADSASLSLSVDCTGSISGAKFAGGTQFSHITGTATGGVSTTPAYVSIPAIIRIK